jgi:L-xylulokinase
VGIFSDFTAGADAMVKSERHYSPDAAQTAHYDRRYQLYLDIAAAMTPIWRRMTEPGLATVEVAA